MKPVHIELFIDRLCGLFPTTNIARNTLKSAWTRDDIMLDASEEDGKAVLKLCESLSKFPASIGEVRHMFRQVGGHIGGTFGCELCDHSGWDVGRQIIDGVETFYTMEFMGNTYTYVKECQCREAA
jgi:hypothetical protein